MAQLVERPVSGTESLIALNNNHIAASMTIGSDWTTIRVGVLLSLQNGSNITGTPRFAFGVCSGLDNPYGASSVDHFVGLVSNETSWISAGGIFGKNASSLGIEWFGGKKVGSTLTLTGAKVVNGATSGVITVVSGLIVEITKGSPNFTIKGCGPINTVADDGISHERFKLAMEAESLTAPVSNSAGAYTINDTGQTLAVSEGTDGTLDCINFHWDKTTHDLEIARLYYARVN